MSLNKLIVSAALALSAISAQAASVDSCIAKVENNCDYSSYSELARIYSSGTCKMLQSPDRVAFISQNGIGVTSVEIDTCATSKYNFGSGEVIDNVVFNNRLFMVLNSHRVAFVGRDNNVYELLTSKGTSYKQVKSVGVDGDNLVMKQDGGGDIVLSSESVLKRIQSERTTRQLTDIVRY